MAKSGRHTRAARRAAPVAFGSRTDVGRVRDHNEDSLVASPPLFAVADGMGGHAAGEVASEIAAATLSEHAPKTTDSEGLGEAVIEANHAVIAAAQAGLGREGMGTTMTAAVLDGARLVLAQVGDSRAYLLHQGKLQQLTRDHSLMADMIEAGQLTAREARTHPQRSVITRALGSDPHMLADLYELNVETDDRLLLCSDGLTTMLFDDAIEDILVRISDPQRCADTLVDAAVVAGGYDNITVIVVDVPGTEALVQKRASRKAKASMVFVVIAFFLAFAAAYFGFRSWVDASAFLAADDGKVAVYRGLPGTLFGMGFFELDHVTDVEVSGLQPGVASRLEEGIAVDGLDAANRLVEQYRAEAAQGRGSPGGGGGAEGGGADPSGAPGAPGTEIEGGR